MLFYPRTQEDTMAVSSPTDTQNELAALSDEGLTEALIMSLLPAQDPDPRERARAEERLHTLRNEAARRRLKLFATS
jgi:hypothetical protein